MRNMYYKPLAELKILRCYKKNWILIFKESLFSNKDEARWLMRHFVELIYRHFRAANLYNINTFLTKPYTFSSLLLYN